jgi:hypothetical protein
LSSIFAEKGLADRKKIDFIKGDTRKRAMFIGFVILALGVLFLLKNLGVIYGDLWDYLWPAAIIALGISIIFKKRR